MIFVPAGKEVIWQRPKSELGEHWEVLEELEGEASFEERIEVVTEPEKIERPTEDDLGLIKEIVSDFPKEFPYDNPDTGKREMHRDYWTAQGLCLVERVRSEFRALIKGEDGVTSADLELDWLKRRVVELAKVETNVR